MDSLKSQNLLGLNIMAHYARTCIDREVVLCQESRLTFTASVEDFNSYHKEDFNIGVKNLLKKFVQAPQYKEGDVWLHVPGIGLIPGSLVTPQKTFRMIK